MESKEKKTITFEELYNRDIKQYVEKLEKKYKDKRSGKEKSFYLSYLSWAYGHREMKRIDPDATEKVHEFPLVVNGSVIEGVKVPYLQTPQGFFVENTVTINGRSETEWLPVLDNSNKPIPNPTSFQINTSNKRCFVKALAKHGLGLYLYVGEDLPENISADASNEEPKQTEPVDEFSENKKIVLNRVNALAASTGKTVNGLMNYIIGKANENLDRADTNITPENISQIVGLVKSLEIKAKNMNRQNAQAKEQQQQGSMLNNFTAQPTKDINWGQPS